MGFNQLLAKLGSVHLWSGLPRFWARREVPLAAVASAGGWSLLVVALLALETVFLV